MSNRRYILAALMLLVSGQASAALIDRGLFTTDNDSGLDWLDVTQTVGLTYDQVLNSSYVVDQSFRYATLEEVISLFDSAGGTGDYLVPRNSSGEYNGVPIPEHYDPATLLLNLMGCTSYIVGQPCDADDQDWHIAMYGPQVTSGLQTAAAVDVYNNSPSGNSGILWVDFVDSVPGRTTADFGSYLVRASTIPLPAPIWLLGTGILGLIFFSKIRRTA